MATIATWPEYAKIMADGFGVSRDPLTVRSEMESGPPKQLQVRTRGMVQRSFRALLTTREDYLAFLSWFKVTIRAGADWFWFRDPVSKQTVEARIVNGLGQENPLIPGKISHWAIQVTLEVWDI